MAPKTTAPKMTAAKKPKPNKAAPKSLIAPPSSGTTSRDALSPETNESATQMQQEAKTSLSRIGAVQVHDKGKRKAPTDAGDWSIDDVAHWLEGEGFSQDICDKFTGAPFSFSSNIPDLHIRRTENDVNGTLLLKLSSKTLKSEIGIKSMGKRDMIMELINGLLSEGGLMAYHAEFG
jgi:hypothetical protein